MHKPVFPLRPRLVGDMAAYLEQPQHIKRLIGSFGSPLNIVFPKSVKENADNLLTELQSRSIPASVYVAHKPNKSTALLRALALSKAHIDVASQGELEHALRCGFTGDRIEATGPKSQAFLLLCLQHNVLVNIDSVTQLHQTLHLHKALGKDRPTTIMLRMGSFASERDGYLSKDSRFGIPYHEMQEAITVCQQSAEYLHLAGFSYHLTSPSLAQHVDAIETAVEHVVAATAVGLQPSFIDIGGGLHTSFVAHPEDWQAYEMAMKQSLFKQQERMTWNDGGFGWWVENGTLRGKATYTAPTASGSPAEQVELLLSQKSPTHGVTLRDLVQDVLCTLVIEPGRAMFDQCGMTVVRVLDVKTSSHGEQVIITDMNRSNLLSQDMELFVDPIVLGKGQGETGYFIAGNLCLGSDLIYRHKTYLAVVVPGDILIFPNTAAYFMDFAESRTLMQSVAQKVAVVSRGDESFVETLDEQYFPLEYSNDL